MERSCYATGACLALGLMITEARALDFAYTNTNGTITITSYTGPGGEVTVPSTIDSLPVVTIGNGAFYGTNVTSVIIPNTVLDIAAGAFNGCYTLTNVTLGQNVRSIGNGAFAGCQLSSIQIPDSVIFIGAFFGGGSLKAITVGSSNPIYSSLDGVLFNKSQTTLLQCPAAKAGNYTIPDGVSIIASNAFAGCYSLATVTIPDSVGLIEPLAFQYAGLSAIVFGLGVTNIGVGGFSGSGLTNVTIPSGISSISDSTFAGCYHLTQVLMPETVTNIGSWAFESCNGLTNLSMPDSVISIGTNAFDSCASLTTVKLGSGLTNIGDAAFENCFRLVDVRIPSHVKTIGSEAFDNTSLTHVTIPDNVTAIGEGAFFYCTNLTNVTIGNGVTKISRTVFEYCTKLTSVTLGSRVSYIDEGVFLFCTSLRSVYCKGNVPGTFPDPHIFGLDNGLPTNVRVYYLPKTSGWPLTFAGIPTALWNPQMRTSDAAFGVQQNRFGFNVTGTANIPLVIEASTEVSNGSWLALQTCTLTNGLIHFNDPQWTNYPGRLYRIRSP